MTIKNFYKTSVNDYPIHIQSIKSLKNKVNLKELYYFDKECLAKDIDFTINLIKFELKFSRWDNEFYGYIFYIDDKIFNKIYNKKY